MLKHRPTLYVFVLIAAIAGCKPAQETKAPPPPPTAAPVPAPAPRELTAAKVPAGGSLVKVSFEGSICHVLGEDGKRINRAVVIRGEPKMVHDPQLIIPDDIDPSGATDLARALGLASLPGGDHGTLKLRLNRVAMRVVDSDGDQAIKPDLDFGPDFQYLVVKLKPLDSNFKDVHADVTEDVPPKDSPVVAYFQFNGGYVSSDVMCGRAAIGTGPEVRFAKVVTVTGFTTKAAKFQIRTATTGSNWFTVPFRHSDVIEVSIVNEANPPAPEHFALNAKLAADTSVKMPKITQVPPDCQSGLSPGCSNTQWP